MVKDEREELIQKLSDAGCSAEEVEEFFVCLEEQDAEQELLFLEKERDCLLNKMHQLQTQIEDLTQLAQTLV